MLVSLYVIVIIQISVLLVKIPVQQQRHIKIIYYTKIYCIYSFYIFPLFFVFSKATIHKGKRIKRKLKVVLTEKLMLLSSRFPILMKYFKLKRAITVSKMV